MLMPTFHRFPNEAAIIMRLLAGYGEIDFSLAVCAGKIVGDLDTVLRAMFRVRSESARIELADVFIFPKLKEQGLDGDYAHILGWIKQCRTIRNRYAHCAWADDANAGLFFTNLEDAARNKSSGFDYDWRHVDVSLLKKQEELFIAALRGLWYLEGEYLVKTEKLDENLYTMPKSVHLPKPYNPPEKHPPPWQGAGPAIQP